MIREIIRNVRDSFKDDYSEDIDLEQKLVTTPTSSSEASAKNKKVDEQKLRWLDRILSCTSTVRIALNSDMKSYEHVYELIKYSIDCPSCRVRLEMKYKDYIFIKEFNHIYDIKNNGEKIWFYMKNTNGRAYCHFDENKFQELGDNFRSGSIVLQEDDMLPSENSIGIGTEALKFIEKIANEQGVKKITGMLSTVDHEHKDRLLHFYKKNGYTISDSEGSILKILN